MSGTVIAQPEVFYTPVLLLGANEGRNCRFSGFGHALGLDQKQLAFAEPQKRLPAFGIGASAKHILTTSCSVKMVRASHWILNC
jgi:hypothetical protein